MVRRIRLIASVRVAASRMHPRTAEVTVRDCAFLTPRMAMHMWSHSVTTIATRVDAFHQRVGHLLGEPLLHLRTACVQFHQPCQFA